MSIERRAERKRKKDADKVNLTKEFNTIKDSTATHITMADTYISHIEQLITSLGDKEDTSKIRGMLTSFKEERDTLIGLNNKFDQIDELLSNKLTLHDGEIDVVDVGLEAGKSSINISTLVMDFTTFVAGRLEITMEDYNA